jgi:hypothetical protein
MTADSTEKLAGHAPASKNQIYLKPKKHFQNESLFLCFFKQWLVV